MHAGGRGGIDRNAIGNQERKQHFRQTNAVDIASEQRIAMIDGYQKAPHNQSDLDGSRHHDPAKGNR